MGCIVTDLGTAETCHHLSVLFFTVGDKLVNYMLQPRGVFNGGCCIMGGWASLPEPEMNLFIIVYSTHIH